MKCNEFFTMSAELPLRENELSSRKARQVVEQDSIDLRRMALFALYFHYIVNPRWLSLPGLTLLLTPPDMDPACEASLIVLG